MLKRKLFRDLRNNFGHFFSVFLLSMLAVMLFTGLESNVIGAKKARKAFHESVNLADAWVYGEGITEEDADKISSVEGVESVQPRLYFTAQASDNNNAHIYVYAESENLVCKPYRISGIDYDPSDDEGVWIAERFASAWGISVGDSFCFTVGEKKSERIVKGIIDSDEYEYMIAPDDLEVDFRNVGYIYIYIFPTAVQRSFSALSSHIIR